MMLKSRAENYSTKEFLKMETINSRLYFQLDDYLKHSTGNPRFLIGGRGFGKTFNALKAITSKSMRRKLRKDGKTPTVFLFKRHERLEVWRPLEKTSFKRDISSINFDEVFGTSSAIIFDDMHYICEKIVNNELPVEFLINLLEKILESTKLEIPIILISDDMLSSYAEKINNDRLDDLLLQFGELSYRKMHELPRNELAIYSKKRNYLVTLQLPPISYEEFEKLFDYSEIKADEFIKKFLYENANGNPRGFAKFVSLFNSNNITTTDFIKLAQDRLSKKEKYSYYLQLCNYPQIPTYINYELLPDVISKFKNLNALQNFYQEKIIFKDKIYEQINLNLGRMNRILKEQNNVKMAETVEKIAKMDDDNKKIRFYNRFLKIIDLDVIKGAGQTFAIPELKIWKGRYDKYMEIYSSLVHIKEQLEMDDEKFDIFWRRIPVNYNKGMLSKALIIAFKNELKDGWYLVQDLEKRVSRHRQLMQSNEDFEEEKKTRERDIDYEIAKGLRRDG